MPDPQALSVNEVTGPVDHGSKGDHKSLSAVSAPTNKSITFTPDEARAVIDKEFAFLLDSTNSPLPSVPPAQLELSIRDLAAAISVDREYALICAAKHSPNHDQLVQAMASNQPSSVANRTTEAISSVNQQFLVLEHAKTLIASIRQNYPVASKVSPILDSDRPVVVKLRELSQYFSDSVPKLKMEFDWIESSQKVLARIFTGLDQLEILERREHELDKIRTLAIEGLQNSQASLVEDVNRYKQDHSAKQLADGELVIANLARTLGHRTSDYYGTRRGVDAATYSALTEEQRSRFIATAVAEFQNTGMLQFRRRSRMRADMLEFLNSEIQQESKSSGLFGRLIEGARVLTRRQRRTLANVLLTSNVGGQAEEAATAILDSRAREALIKKMLSRDASYRTIRVVQDDHAAGDLDQTLTQETEEALQELRR